MALKSWSTTAANNATADATISWAENMPPSNVNDSSRAMMAAIRADYEDREWRDWGHTVTRTGNTTFTIAGGVDLTSIYAVNRPIRCTDSSTLYGYISASSYSAPTNTITVTLDSGNLSASLTAVSLGVTPSTKSIPFDACRGALTSPVLTTPTIDGYAVGMVKLNSGSVSAAATLSIVMTSYTAYRNKLLVVNLIPATDGVALYGKVSTDGGSTYDATGYEVANVRSDSSASTVTGSFGNGNAQVTIIGVLPDGIGNGSNEGLGLDIHLYDTVNTSARPRISFSGCFVNSAATPRIVGIHGAGMRATAQDTDAFQLLFSSGNITSGTWALYGYN